MSYTSGETLADIDSLSREPEPAQKERAPGVLSLLGRTLLLGSEPYTAVRDGEKPARRGFVILLVIIGLVVLAQWIGYWLGALTAPRLGSLQSLLYNAVIGLPWYTEQVQLNPTFATQFQQGYLVAWEGLRALLGYPTVTATGVTVILVILATLLNWFVFAVLAHWLARWYGSSARFEQTLGVLALAYAPLLLRTVEIVPGAVAPTMLIFLLMLATKHQALKTVHGLGAVATLSVLLAPYLIVLVVLAVALLNGGAYGLAQNPTINQALQVQQFLSQ
ncbi:MAG TPA: hypothetical protein DCL15_05550 [Chloroflexi bacterium]|nr:hypothetical protein [Chloroflexota bacterium]HHW85083.1 hypothetical protein [Chloroflexota bacterium]